MAEARQTADAPRGSAGAPGCGATVLRVAWLAVLLGLGMEAWLVLIVL